MMEKVKKEYTVAERTRIGRNAGIVGIAVNLLLFSMKIAAGIISSSVAVIADAVNNLSDAGSSVILMVSYILSGKPADKEHPNGHARIEYLSTLFISLIIAFLGFELFKSSVGSIVDGGEKSMFDTVSVVIMAASVLLKLFLAVYFRRTGKKIGSASLEASAVDSIGDVASTCAVILGMVLSRWLGPAVDGVVGCGIAVYIFCLGVKLIKESSDTLLGVAPDTEKVHEIVKKLESYDGVLGIHDLIMHNYGESRFFASVHVEVDSRDDIMLSHDRIDNIEHDFQRDMGISLVIHLDPVCVGDERLDSLREAVKRILGKISDETGHPVSMHDFRAVFGVTHTNLIFDVVISYDFPLSEREICEKISRGVSEFDGKYYAVVTVDRDFTATAK